MQFLKNYLFLAPILIAAFLLWRQLLTPGVRHWANARMSALFLLPGLGFVSPSLWLYYGAVLATMIFLPRSRIEAVGLYILLALMLPLSPYAWRVGEALLTTIDVNLVLALGLLTSFRFPNDKTKQSRIWTDLDTAFALMLILLIVISIRVPETSVTTGIRSAVRYIVALGVPYWLISRAPISQIDPRRILHYVAMAGFILSIEAVFELLRSWPLYQSIDTNLGTSSGLSKTMAQRGGFLRAPGPFFESTSFGFFLALAGIIVFAFRSIFSSAFAHRVAIAVCCAGCFSALGRNGWIGLVVGIMLANLFRGKAGKVAVFTVAGAGLAGIFFLAAPESGTLGNLVGTTGHASSTVDYRENLITNSIPIIKENPIFGTGIDEVRKILRPVMRSQNLSVDFVNSYLYFLILSGICGLSIFVFYTFLPIVKISKMRKISIQYLNEFEVVIALFSTLIAIVIMVISTSYFERIPLLALILAACTRQIIIRLAKSDFSKSRQGGKIAVTA